MSEYQPLSTAAEADMLDMDDCVAGYQAGLRASEEPGSQYSKSYWHGWRNGMIDRGLLPVDAASTNLCREIVRRQNAH
jgi:hypothetical protein